MEITEPSWKKALAEEFTKPYFQDLTGAVREAYRTSQVFPAQPSIFKALTLCPFKQTKVVILGQDPYHGAGQAHGLAFSVPDKVKIPPSLKNIHKELKSDLGIELPKSGNLANWTTQGVLLLNSTLTVTEGKPSSHQKFGWETFTDSLIKAVSDDKEHVAFLLWGKFAEAKTNLIDQSKHLVLTAPHPSPLSAHRGFLGCKHFSRTNDYLKKHKLPMIKW